MCMVNVSKRKLKEEVSQSIRKQFISFVSNLESAKDTELFLGELLTKSEQIQLIKRFAILVMLQKGYRFDDIVSTLKVSPTTVSRLQTDRLNECFCEITHHIELLTDSTQKSKNDSYAALREYFEILMLPLPPIVGKHRWRNLDRLLPVEKPRRYRK